MQQHKRAYGHVYFFLRPKALLLKTKTLNLVKIHACVTRARSGFTSTHHQTKFYCFCGRSEREKAWRSRKRVAQAT
jgi:hypothetical protein